MEQKTVVSVQGPGSTRAVYEAPAIEQTATFERLTLACSRTPAEIEEPGEGMCIISTVNS